MDLRSKKILVIHIVTKYAILLALGWITTNCMRASFHYAKYSECKLLSPHCF